MKITEINSVYSKISDPSLIKDLLSYEKKFWRREGYRKVPTEYRKSIVTRDGVFLTGFIPKIISSFQEKFPVDRVDYEIRPIESSIKGISFREDQIRQIKSATEKSRGVLLAPTGTGKTVLMAGIISSYPKKKILFLCHTIDLVDQAANEFEKFGLNVSKYVGKSKDLSGNIVVSTIQSFSKLDPEIYCDLFDVVLCDECHHMSKFPDKKNKGGLFYRVLTSLLAPVRFAVTATYPVDKETALCLEGLIGPVISELSFSEAVSLDILAVPRIDLVPVDPFDSYEVRTYSDIYDRAIVHNENRNRQVIKSIKRLNRQGLTTLTYVQRIDHLKNLVDMAKDMGVVLYDIQGSVKGEDRLDIKDKLYKKEIMNVVATVVWREGINIKSLNAIILAGGGKNEKDLIQACGRGARKDEGKDEFVIVDFVDSAKYLSQHFCERLKTYIKKGWL
jgi:superfamily II DNA or RNA helicase